MFFRFSRGLAATLLICFAVTACQTATRDDLYQDRTEILPWESRFNTFTFLPPGKKYEIDQSTETNGDVIVETIRAPKQLFIHVQHVSNAWFSQRAKAHMEDRAKFDGLLTEIGGTFDVTPLSGSVLGPNGYTAENDGCSVARFSKRSRNTTIWDNDHGDPDTIVTYIACDKSTNDGYPSATDFVRQFDLMTPDQEEQVRNRFAVQTGYSQTRKPQKQLAAPVSFKVEWATKTSSYSGFASLQDDTLIVALPGDVDCEIEQPLLASFKKGRWRLNCGDGQTASGFFSTPTETKSDGSIDKNYARTTASGSDSSGNKIKMSFGALASLLAKQAF